MKAVAYSIKPCEKEILIKANKKKHDITLISNRLTSDTVSYAEGKDAVLVFTSDDLSAPVIRQLKEAGVKYIATRSTGTDHIDLIEASRLSMKVANVPAYSPESVAEHTLALVLSLCRNICASQQQVKQYNFTLDNLLGATISNKTIGVVGFGKTGEALVRILRGFGSRVIVHDIKDVREKCKKLNAEQVSYDDLLIQSDIISFHVPLTDETRHMVNSSSIEKMKEGVMLVNVSRGAVFNSKDVLNALEEGKISKLGMDVYEFEQNVFFFDHSRKPVDDPLLKAFIDHPRILITPHQAFLTREALLVIAEKTIQSLDVWSAGKCVGAACCCTNDCLVHELAEHK